MIEVTKTAPKEDDSMKKLLGMLQIYATADNLSSNSNISMGNENRDMSGSKVNQGPAMQRRYDKMGRTV